MTAALSPAGVRVDRRVIRLAAKEIERLREALLVMLVETDDSEYMTQREQEEFARQALVPNAELRDRPQADGPA